MSLLLLDVCVPKKHCDMQNCTMKFPGFVGKCRWGATFKNLVSGMLKNNHENLIKNVAQFCMCWMVKKYRNGTINMACNLEKYLKFAYGSGL